MAATTSPADDAAKTSPEPDDAPPPLRYPASAREMQLIAAFAGLDVRTTTGAYAGIASLAATERTAAAALALGFHAPPRKGG